METVRITEAFEVREISKPREGRVCVQLLRPLEYRVGSQNSNEVIIVPVGYITDFASVPRGMWNLFPPLGPWARGAIVHDYLYSQGGVVNVLLRYTRKECDKIFKEAMTVLFVPLWQREAMYYAVRLGGRSGWNKNNGN